jgi:hypothetical protein
MRRMRSFSYTQKKRGDGGEKGSGEVRIVDVLLIALGWPRLNPKAIEMGFFL